MGILNSAPENPPENPSQYISVTMDDGLFSVEVRSGEPLARSQGPADHAIMVHNGVHPYSPPIGKRLGAP